MPDSYLANGQSPDDHVAACPDCAAAIALLDRPGASAEPPPALRAAVLSTARRRRSPAVAASVTGHTPVGEALFAGSLRAGCGVRTGGPAVRRGRAPPYRPGDDNMRSPRATS